MKLTRSGLSLLEVVLAISILAVVAAYMATAMQQASTNALTAQRQMQAELVAESVVNQIIAGFITPDPVSWTPYMESQGQTDWVYQIQQVPAEIPDMLGIQVAVQKVDPNLGIVQDHYDLFLNRWIINPDLLLDTPVEDEGYGGEGYGGAG